MNDDASDHTNDQSTDHPDHPDHTDHTDDDGAADELTRTPKPGQLPSDTDVQAERQEEGVEAEYEAAARKAVHGSEEGADLGAGAD